MIVLVVLLDVCTELVKLVLFVTDRVGAVSDCGVDEGTDCVVLDVVLVVLDCVVDGVVDCVVDGVVDCVVDGVVDCVSLDVVLVALDCDIDEVLFEVSEGPMEKAYCGKTSITANKMKNSKPSFILIDLSNLVNKELLYIVQEHC